MKKLLVSLITVIMITSLLGIPVQAETSSVSFALPVTQLVTLIGDGAEASDAVVDYELSPVTANAPMPAGTEGGVYSFQITGEQDYQIPEITFRGCGEWDYKLTAEGSEVTPNEIDVAIFVTMTNGEKNITVVASLPSGEKCELKFTAKAYGPEPTATPTPTPEPTATPTPTPEPTATPTPTPEPTATPTPEPTDVPVEPTATPTPEPTATPTPEPTDVPVEPTATPTPEPTEVPVEPTEVPVEPTDKPTPPGPPKTGEDSWSLLNLILTVITVGICFGMIAAKRANNNKFMSLAPAVISAAVFLLAEDMRLPMQLTNGLTPAMVCLFAVNAMLAFFTRRTAEQDDAEASE